MFATYPVRDKLVQFGAVVLLATLASATAPANDSQSAKSPEQGTSEDYSQYYTGAFSEYSVRAGANFNAENAYDGWSLDLGFRHSFPMQVGDVRLAYQYDVLGEEADSLPGPIEQHNVGAYLAIHPAYLLLLGSDWLSYTVGSIYAEIGVGAQFGALERRSDGVFETDVGPFVTFGGGLDVPLWDPDVGQAPWLNIVYRYHVADFDRPSQTYDVDLHSVMVGVGWRINGLLF